VRFQKNISFEFLDNLSGNRMTRGGPRERHSMPTVGHARVFHRLTLAMLGWAAKSCGDMIAQVLD
jgi:hypothetical protein